ncbi:uracil-DNA glycosylase [Sandarakinorhabdus sp.]|uniref:uracil-DNA glycosylase n=1 Tax=Sandarakinorhabdus sp. TaxID=1916663 RepID=UPI00286D8471|nr:uracil-DNA glycosylase [Sandarakinorhabdus sp.]
MIGELRLDPGWKAALAAVLASPHMAALRAFLVAEMAGGKTIFPPGSEWFHALDLTPPDQVRVVILGQDPYHGPGQAHGLAFSVRHGVKVPPSLANIYKELHSDLGIAPARHGNLRHWARQGVLLLNTVLTVEQGRAASHKGRGWEQFTDAVIWHIAAQDRPVVFLLWGKHAQQKAAFVDDARHLVLRSVHPSPLSAYAGFFGCRHFSRTNAFLMRHGQTPIDWASPSA